MYFEKNIKHMNKKQKAVFIKTGSFSYINENVYKILQKKFPDFQIDVIDVLNDLISLKDPFIWFYCFKDYGKKIFLGKKFIAFLLRTPYAFKKARKAFFDKVRLENYSFTFQTGSVFDFSIPGIPHFVYSDHTHLNNLSYLGFDSRQLCSSKWIECERTIYQNASLNFTMSSNISKSLIEVYSIDSNKVFRVNCGANIEPSQDEVIDENKYTNSNILFVGIDWHRKGGPVLLEAFKTIIKSYPNVKLTIVGCNPKVDIPNCKVVGKVPPSEVRKYFQQASIFCLPTTIEPFGVVFLEAMAHKLPIVATNLGAIPDFVHERLNGFLVEPNNPFQLSKKIIDLIESPKNCSVFGQYGFNLLQKQYTWEKTGINISKNIERFLAS